MSDVTSSGDRRLPAVEGRNPDSGDRPDRLLRRRCPAAAGGGNPGIEDVLVGGIIRLGQLLKLADVVDSGGEAKALLATGEVTVNGELEQRRGRQLSDGDVVVAAGRALRVVATS